MRTIATLLFCLLASSAQAQGLDLKVGKASRDVVVRAAALGNMQFIENKLMVIRLYGFSVSGTCIPESHQVCGHHYVLFTSSYDEAPVFRAYDLGKVGEITKVAFAGSQEAKVQLIEITVQSYASSALKSNPRLSKRTKKFRLKLSETEAEIVD
ncbi:hypothetical protein ACFL2F_01075 [Myxococcota bacterium]